MIFTGAGVKLYALVALKHKVILEGRLAAGGMKITGHSATWALVWVAKGSEMFLACDEHKEVNS